MFVGFNNPLFRTKGRYRFFLGLVDSAFDLGVSGPQSHVSDKPGGGGGGGFDLGVSGPQSHVDEKGNFRGIVDTTDKAGNVTGTVDVSKLSEKELKDLSDDQGWSYSDVKSWKSEAESNTFGGKYKILTEKIPKPVRLMLDKLSPLARQIATAAIAGGWQAAENMPGFGDLSPSEQDDVKKEVSILSESEIAGTRDVLQSENIGIDQIGRGAYTEQELLEKAIKPNEKTLADIWQRHTASGPVEMRMKRMLDDYVGENPEYQDVYDSLMDRGDRRKGKMYQDINSYLTSGFLPEVNGGVETMKNEDETGTDIDTIPGAQIPGNVQAGLDQYVTETGQATTEYKDKAQQLSEDYQDFENKYFGEFAGIKDDYRQQMADIPGLAMQMPTSMGGARVGLAPKVHQRMYGDEAKTLAGIIGQQAGTSLQGITGRQGLAQNVYGVDFAQAGANRTPADVALDLFKQQEAGRLGLQQVEAGRPDKPSGWSTWAPVVAGALAPNEQGTSAVDELVSIVGGLFE